jgi:tetrahydromethanopterin S-methyltransferase subunit E
MLNKKDDFNFTLVAILIAAHYGLFTTFKDQAMKAQTGSSIVGMVIGIILFPLSYFLFKKNLAKSFQYSIITGLVVNLAINLTLIYFESL